jgi:hypothetical protein
MTNSQTFQAEAVDALLPALDRVRSSATGQECSCDGGGWIVTLDRDRYMSPGDAGMVRYTRCVCLEQALSKPAELLETWQP